MRIGGPESRLRGGGKADGGSVLVQAVVDCNIRRVFIV
jgi:hypothetical protein